ncbi:glycosyltransferase family 2 protein [Cryobacterium lactosi]|uniref:Glycosyltransferase family 2 protein n=1 Tax=Cryobacterium lactosi TaxID=1259202 RepID=A0A4V3IWB2_9MICO|nr:glycosyltransferase family A protein [Cryobacterium lactosi]TFD84560.1 glycosyltransferase family 2 protein [Cryobacterium lactosi]
MRIVRPTPLKGRPTVSVVVPCYNYGRYLPEAVGSILSQPGVDLEVIIVDDHSTDGSELVAAELAARHEQVRLIRNAVNKRHIATYNRGLAETTGDYVVLLSADDMLADGALARAVALMERYPNVGLVYGYAPGFSETPEASAAGRTWSIWPGREWVGAVTHRGDSVVINPEVVMRNSVMRRLVGYDAAYPHAADLLLWLQAATLSDVGRVNGVQAHYRTHAQQMHVTDYSGTLTDMRERTAVYRDFLNDAEWGRHLQGNDRMLRNALRSTSREAVWCALLAEMDPTATGGSGSDFRNFARTQYPPITRTLLWKELDRRRQGRKPAIPDAVLSLVYRVKWAVKWRMWRRWGL